MPSESAATINYVLAAVPEDVLVDLESKCRLVARIETLSVKEPNPVFFIGIAPDDNPEKLEAQIGGLWDLLKQRTGCVDPLAVFMRSDQRVEMLDAEKMAKHGWLRVEEFEKLESAVKERCGVLHERLDALQNRMNEKSA